jgi:ribosomal 50S subunit-recycling heat shock protein
MSKPDSEHFDKLGNQIKVNDVVAVSHHNSLMIARVTKLNTKMIKVKEFRKTTYSWDTGEHNKYANETVKLHEADAVMYILKYT